MKRSILCLLLLAAILMTSCGQQGGSALSGTDDTDTVSSPAETPEEVPEETKVLGSLPARNFDGREFRVLARSSTYPQFDSYEIYAEEETGEVLNDAIYQRNRYVEEEYNLTVTENKVASPGSQAFQEVQAGETAFDYVVSQENDIYSKITTGAFYNLYDGEHFDFDQPWWHESINESISLGGRMYFAMNDYLLLYKQQTYCLMFNKDMAENYGLENPYTVVADGRFTWDYMYSDMKAVSYDLNGDGVMDQLDNYGFTAQYGQLLASVVGADVTYSVKDEEDWPVLQVNTSHHMDVLDKISSIFMDTSTTLLANDYSYSVTTGKEMWDIPSDTFYAGRALYIGGVVRYAANIVANCDAAFGILPLPKFSETQDNYYTFSEVSNSTVFAVPVTVSLEETSFVLEAMSKASYRIVVPAYYEVTLKSKYSPDEKATEILDLLFAHHRFDTALLYSWLDVSGIYNTILSKKENTFASLYAASEKKTEKSMELFRQQIEKNGGQ
ncbi:MAG: hypothetical protein ACI4V1_04195 [Eubacteriales bacterium]